jgi:hypothetical protein
MMKKSGDPGKCIVLKIFDFFIEKFKKVLKEAID